MALAIRYSPRADRELFNLLRYLRDKWGIQKAKEIDHRIEQEVLKIAQMPALYPQLEYNQDLHRFVFSKQTSIYYKITEMHLEIVSVWDNRMNPSDLDL